MLATGQVNSQLCGEMNKVMPRCGGILMVVEYEILSHGSECCIMILVSSKLTWRESKFLKPLYEVYHNSY